MDTDGNIYARLKTQGRESNPRFHLWLDGKVRHYYRCEIKKVLVRQASERLMNIFKQQS